MSSTIGSATTHSHLFADDLLSTMAGPFAESRGRAAEEIYGELWKQPASRSSDDDGGL